MKKIINFIFIILLAFSACKKTSNSVSSDITEDEGINLMAGSLSVNSNGFITSSADIAVNSQDFYTNNTVCGSTKSYTATHQNAAGASPTYSNTFTYGYTLNCNTNNLPDNITGTAIDKGSFDSPNLTSTNSGSATFRIAGFTPTSAVYVINGEYKRTGSFTSKIDNKTSGNSVVDIVISNLVINKTTKTVVSGTATATVTGTSAKGTTINFSSNIKFNTDGTATATLNNPVYIIDLITGIITKK